MNLGEAWVSIGTKDTELTKGLATAQSKVSKSAEAMKKKLGDIGKGMAIAGAAITGTLALIVTKTAAAGDQFDKMSLRTGVTVENLSSLAYACDISGTNIEGLEVGIKFLTKGMDDASQGIGLAKDAFDYLGMSVTDVEGNLRPTIDVMKEAATKIAAIENPAKQAALAMEIFGARSGTQLLPLLKMGGAGIEELMNKAKELGITITTEAATAAALFTDRLTDLKGSLAGAGREIGNVLIPIITPLIEKVVEIIGKIKAWAEENKPLVETIVKFVAAAGGIMVVLGPILIALPLLTTLFSGLGVVIAAICSPIGLVVAAAIALYLAWQTNFGGIRDFTIAVVDGIKEVLGWLWDKVIWVAESLGLIKKPVEEVITVTDELAVANEEAATAADTFTTANDSLGDSLGEIPEKAKEAGEAIISYADDVTNNYIALSVKATESWADFYAFWEAEAKRTAETITKTTEAVAKKIDNTLKKVKSATGEITIESDFGIKHAGSYEEAKINVGGGDSIGDAIARAYAAGATPSYAVGTPYVPRTELAMVHKGEKITPANQNTYDQRKNYSSISIQPGAINIITPKFSSSDGQELFRQLERQIKMRGLRLVRA